MNKARRILTFRTEAIVPFDNSVVTCETQFAVQREVATKTIAASRCYKGSPGTCWYTKIASVRALKAIAQAHTQDSAMHKDKILRRQARRDANAQVTKDILPLILLAFDFHPHHWEHGVWTEVANECGQLLVDYLGKETSHVGVRKLLRLLMRAAKECQREDFPQGYRDADDKDDFYRDNENAIAEFIIEDLK